MRVLLERAMPWSDGSTILAGQVRAKQKFHPRVQPLSTNHDQIHLVVNDSTIASSLKQLSHAGACCVSAPGRPHSQPASHFIRRCTLCESSRPSTKPASHHPTKSNQHPATQL